MYLCFFKRPIDFLGSLALLMAIWPLLLVVWLLVRVKLGSPVIFAHERPGKDEKIFTLYKFRTMTDARDATGNLLSDKERLPPLGILLRKLSLDELPQLFNVLKGDMSFVGPRPLLPQYLPYYTEEEKKRHKVRPGITGLTQVSGRNDLSWDQKFKIDILYVSHITFWSDLKIVLRTIKKVLRSEGVQAVPEFVAMDDERKARATPEKKRPA